MKDKYITLDYEEYIELEKNLDRLRELIRKIYSTTENNNLKKEIEDYMRINDNWV